MLVNLYRSNTPLALFSLPLVTALFASIILFESPVSTDYFFEWHRSVFEVVKSNSFTDFFSTVLISSLIAHQLNLLFNKHNFYSKYTYLPGFVFILSSASFGVLNFSPELFAQGFLVLGLSHLLKLRRQEDAKKIIFFTSFYFGLASVFSLMMMPLLFLPWLALMAFRPFVWREWIMVVLGFTLPNIYLFSVLYLMDDNIWLSVRMTDIVFSELVFNPIQLTLFGIFVLVFLMTLSSLVNIIRLEVVRFKKHMRLLLQVFLISLIIFVLAWFYFDLYFFALLIPSSLFISVFILNFKRELVVNILLGIWFIICLVNIWY